MEPLSASNRTAAQQSEQQPGTRLPSPAGERPTESAGTTATDTPLEGAGGTGDAAVSEDTTITVATDESYDSRFVPASLEAPANTPGTLIFKNISTIHHNLLFPAPISEKTKLVVAAGAVDTIIFTIPAADTYGFYCSIHLGMEGTLQIK